MDGFAYCEEILPPSIRTILETIKNMNEMNILHKQLEARHWSWRYFVLGQDTMPSALHSKSKHSRSTNTARHHGLVLQSSQLKPWPGSLHCALAVLGRLNILYSYSASSLHPGVDIGTSYLVTRQNTSGWPWHLLTSQFRNWGKFWSEAFWYLQYEQLYCFWKHSPCP